MPTPQVTLQPDAGAHLRLGFDLLADLLAPTLGPVGGLVANQQHTDTQPELLDDAATAVRRVMSLGDPRLDVGAMLMRNLVWRITQRVGDGGAMTAVLARAIFRDALRLTTAGVNPMIMAKGLRAGAEAVRLALTEQAHPVHTEDELAAVALTVTNDRPLAQMLGEISYLLGADAHVITEKLVAPYLARRYFAGANFPAQIASLYFFTDPARQSTVMAGGLLALVDGTLTRADDAVHLLTLATQAEATGLTILATGFGDAALSVLVTNHQAAEPKLTVAGVKLTAVNEALRHGLDDLALLTGATILGRPHTRPVAKAQPQDLAPIRRAEILGGRVYIQPQRAATPRLHSLTAELRAALATLPQDAEERPLLQRRLAALTGGMGLLQIGAGTKRETELRNANAERGLKVLSAAQHTGVVAGGGAALLHCRPALAPILAQFAPDSDEYRGVQVLHRALAAPLTQILENAQVDAPAVWLDRVAAAGPRATYDVLSGRVVDAWDAGILDVAQVMDLVIQTSVSGASIALSTDAIVYHRKPMQSLEP